MYVDSHCHLEMSSYDKDLDDVIRKSADEGLQYILTVGTEESYFARVRTIVDRYPFIYGAIGIHPHNAKDYNDRTEKVILEAAQHPRIVGYGEVGLDFFKNHSPRDAQKRVFARQLSLARQIGLPVIIHSREAREETIDILQREYSGAGVIHCYSYDTAAAKRFLDMGFLISIPGTITYKTASTLQDVVRYVPADRLLAETDAPFLTPHPHRGKRNLPYYVKLTVEAMARIRGIEAASLARVIRDNFVGLFLQNRSEATI